MICLDYGRSFVCTNGPDNAPQFWIESRCLLVDEGDGSQEEFYQCGSCKSEHTFADRNLFQDPNYDFLPVFGPRDVAIFRRRAQVTDSYIQYVRGPDIWGGARFVLREAAGARRAEGGPEIVRAAMAGVPFVGRTEIRNPDTRLRATLEYPVKTMNANEVRGIYQVDTGPVLLPDLTRRAHRKIETLRLAFVAFNGPDFADFVIERPTPVTRNGEEVGRVHHYSGIVSMPAANTVYTVG